MSGAELRPGALRSPSRDDAPFSGESPGSAEDGAKSMLWRPPRWRCRCRELALLATCPSRLTYHLTGHYGHRVRAAFLYPRLYAWHWRIFFVAIDLALSVDERLRWTVVSGGAAAPGMLLRALWTTYLSRQKSPNTPEVRSKGVLPRLAGRFSPARFDSYPSDNMPFEAISNVCCADFHERRVVAMEGRRLPSIRLGAFFCLNRISYETNSL